MGEIATTVGFSKAWLRRPMGWKSSPGPRLDLRRHGSGVRWGNARSPRPSAWREGITVPSGHRRPGYPSSGYVPAEPDSVSPGGKRVAGSVARIKAEFE